MGRRIRPRPSVRQHSRRTVDRLQKYYSGPYSLAQRPTPYADLRSGPATLQTPCRSLAITSAPLVVFGYSGPLSRDPLASFSAYAMVQRSVRRRLSPAGFRGAVLEGDRAALYARGAGALVIPPEGAVRPADPDDLALLVRWAAQARCPLVPRGAGTGIPGGNIGRGVIVHLAESFDHIGAPDIDSRTIEVGASAVAADVDRAARAAGLFLPPLPSSADRCTIGGMIANNAAGARSLRYGAIREWVDALDVVLATGDRWSVTPTSAPPPPLARFRWTAEIGPDQLPAGWPRVRKNSSGYALDRYLATRSPVQILAGSEGTLAFVVAARLRLQPLPPARALAAVALRALDSIPRMAVAATELGAAACELFGQRFLRLAAPQAASLFAEPLHQCAAVLLIELEAESAHTIDDQVDSLSRISSETDAAILRVATTPVDVERLWEFRHAASPTIAAAVEQGVVPLRFIEDSVVPADRVPAYLDGVQRLLAEVDMEAAIFGHAGDGNIHVNPLVDITSPEWRARVRAALDATTDLVRKLGGTLSGEHGDGRLRAPLLDRIWPPHLVAGFQTLKAAFDPEGILNPGVILPEPGQDPLDGLSAPGADYLPGE